MKYYLAGPMSGIEAYNFPMFEKVVNHLRETGLNIDSPHEIDHGETDENRGSLPYKTYIMAAVRMLMECDAIIVLPGWSDSEGARFEMRAALMFKMETYRFDTATGRIYTMHAWEVKDAVK